MNEAFRGTVMIITEVAATEVTRGYLTGEIHSALRTSVRNDERYITYQMLLLPPVTTDNAYQLQRRRKSAI